METRKGTGERRSHPTARRNGWLNRQRLIPVLVAFALVLLVGSAFPITTAIRQAFAAHLKADIRADVNRDGVVDITGDSDVAGKTAWTLSRGAIFLPNIGDAARRCSSTGNQGKQLSDDELAACNDASDDIAHAPENLTPLRTVPIADVPSDAAGTLQVIGAGKEKVRLFIKRGNTWSKITDADQLKADELRAGVELGLDGKDVVRDSKVWDGTVTVRFTVKAGSLSSQDDVVLREAPVLTHHHVQQAQEILVAAGGMDNPDQSHFVQDLARLVKDAGISTPLRQLNSGDDQWAQDYVEPGYASMPGPDGKPRVIRIMIRSAQKGREAGRVVFTDLRGPGIGAIQMSGKSGYNQIDSMGNLETIPPYSYNGHNYPVGRIIMGQHGNTKPDQEMLTFLESQGLQKPLLLDTSWLLVGHVDEFVQFLPAKNGRGWIIALADPTGGLDLLRAAQKAGKGETPVFSRPQSDGDPVQTINQVLADTAMIQANTMAAQKIAANLETLKRETGINDAEVIKIPAVYVGLDFSGNTEGPGGVTLAGSSGVNAYIPGAINGIVLSPTQYIAPRQWGPVIDGKDIFAEAVSAAYAKAGMSVSYLDDWATHHYSGGEVHCGTNTLRDTSAPWWPTSK